MVKGISRQVIVVEAPEPKLFDQAIFILKDEVVGKQGVTEDMLLKEATRMINRAPDRKRSLFQYGLFWACSGAVVSSLVWLIGIL